MKFPRIFIGMICAALWLSACIPEGQVSTAVPMAASPIPKNMEATATASSAPLPTQTIPPTSTAVVNTTTPVASQTSLPQTSSIPPDWQVYNNPQHSFELSYPPGSKIVEDEPEHARIDLPFQPGTTLQEKYLTIDVTPLQADGTCSSPFAAGYAPEAIQRETITIGGNAFFKESGAEGAAGSTYEWVAYSSARGQECASLTFILHATNAANYDVPPPEFDPQAEKEIFEQIVSSFNWLE